MKEIPLTRNLAAIVDDDDFEWLTQWKWYAANLHGNYVVAERAIWLPRRRVILMHRAIMNAPDGKVVDHINGNTLDNRRCNLRICDQAENALNQRKKRGTRSRYKGVFWDPVNHKWCAQMTFRGKHIWLGRHAMEIDAARAYDRGAVEHFGEFARLNFPRGE